MASIHFKQPIAYFGKKAGVDVAYHYHRTFAFLVFLAASSPKTQEKRDFQKRRIEWR